MSTPASGTMLGWREYTTARRGGMGSCMVNIGVGKAVHARAGSARVRDTVTALAHRVGQRDQVVLVGVGG